MSQHHSTPADSQAHPIKLAIIVAAGTLALIVGIILLAYYAVGTHGIGAESKGMSPEETVKRIAPVARLVTEQAPGASATPQTKTAAATPAAAKADGKALYTQTCSVCHATGVANSPKLGDKAAWAPRIKAGIEALHANALKGKNAMPPKGGNTALADADVKAAVDYMVSQSK
jgi:cytochrome c5